MKHPASKRRLSGKTMKKTRGGLASIDGGAQTGLAGTTYASGGRLSADGNGSTGGISPDAGSNVGTRARGIQPVD